MASWPPSLSGRRTRSMHFNESNTVEAFIRDQLCGAVTHHTAVGPGLARRNRQISGLGWHYLSAATLPRQPQEVLVEDHLRDALIRLNPSIAAQPDRVDEVLYRLRAILMIVRESGLDQTRGKLAESSFSVSKGGVLA
jgi:type I restriction enzyme, R subunit